MKITISATGKNREYRVTGIATAYGMERVVLSGAFPVNKNLARRIAQDYMKNPQGVADVRVESREVGEWTTDAINKEV